MSGFLDSLRDYPPGSTTIAWPLQIAIMAFTEEDAMRGLNKGTTSQGDLVVHGDFPKTRNDLERQPPPLIIL